MTRRTRWGRRPQTSLRLRVVLITAVAVTAMVAVGELLSIWAVRGEFLDVAVSRSRDRAVEVAQLVENGSLPASLPIFDEGETLVQVVREDGVVSRTQNISKEEVLPLPLQTPGSTQSLTVDDLPGVGDGPYEVTAVGATSPQGTVTVFAAVGTEDVHELVRSAIGTGSLGLILLVLPLSGLLWVAVGRTLSPVEAIRERAAAITADQLSERVPEPPQLDEIGRLARTINAMLARLDVSATEQRRFLADAAHELRSPVASLRAQLETVREGKLQAESAEVQELLADTLRMQTLVDQLLLLARSDAAALRRANVAVDLDDIVGTVVGARRLENEHPEITIDTSEVAPVQVMGDPVLLEQLVRNLLDNAVTHAVRQVQVSLTDQQGSAVLTVDDDGPGIPPQSREEVFRRFARLDEARDRHDGGVGLGLAIVADILRAHGGSVEVRDAPSGGARFRVLLPSTQ